MLNIIKNMQSELDKERELYTPEIWDKFYNMKVYEFMKDIDFNIHKTVIKPLININEKQAKRIADGVKREYRNIGIDVKVNTYLEEVLSCYMLMVEYNGDIDKENGDKGFHLVNLEMTKRNKYLHNYEATYVNDDGHEKVYELVSRKDNLDRDEFGELSRLKADAVGIIVFNEKKDKVLLQKEWRMACNEWVYNLPGGLVNKGETFGQAAKRELREETGLTLDSVIYTLPPSYTAVGLSNESVATVICTASGDICESDSVDELIEARWYDASEVLKLIKLGKAMSLRTQTFLYMWVMGDLKGMW